MALRGSAVRVRLAPFQRVNIKYIFLLLEEEIGHNVQLYLPNLRCPTLLPIFQFSYQDTFWHRCVRQF